MYKGRLLAVFIVFLSGCVTTRNIEDNQIRQLQNRINYLDSELREKDEEISHLETKLEGIRWSKTQAIKGSNNIGDTLSVKQIQKALKNAGFYKGKIDGKMGMQTREAIKSFQETYGLKVDSIVGKTTSSKLRKYLER